MTNNNRTQRVYRLKSRDLPLPRHRRRTRYHNSRTHKAEKKRPFEALKQSGEFFEERCVFYFFWGGSPGHVDFEEVAEEGLGYVQRDSTKKDGEKRKPFEVFEDWEMSDGSGHWENEGTY